MQDKNQMHLYPSMDGPNTVYQPQIVSQYPPNQATNPSMMLPPQQQRPMMMMVPDANMPMSYQQQQMLPMQQMPMQHTGMPVQQVDYTKETAVIPISNPNEIRPVQAGPQSGYSRLEGLDGIYIKQKLEVLELVTGCETENRYEVYPLKKNGERKKVKIFKCKEKSNCFTRNCLSGGCRPFKMKINTVSFNAEEEDEPFLMLERPCKCTCLCFARPYLTVTLVEGGRSEYFGKIRDPWNWCDMEFQVFDKDDRQIYQVNGNCCQLGMWCRWPCESCQTINFEVRSPSGEVLSTMQKQTAGCVKTWATDMDNFVMNFPPGSTLAQKALLMACVLFVDYRHFEQGVGESKNEYNR